jgi:putative salt-induced outer membrane protein
LCFASISVKEILMSLITSTSAPLVRAVLALGLSFVVAASAQAQAKEPDNQWHGGISVGGALASGNTNSRVLTGSADAVKENKVDKVSLYGLVNYGSNKAAGVTTTTSNQLRLGGRYDYNLSDKTFVFGGAELETNKAGGLQSRYGLNGGVGYKVIRTATTTFDVFAGLGYSGVKFTNNTSANGVELVLGEESTHKLSETTTAKQRLVIRPGQGDLGTLTTFDAGLATAISGGWTLNTGLSIRSASKVAVGVKGTDTLITVGFGYKY